MNLRDFFSSSKEHFLSKKESKNIVQEIIDVEKKTSGEIRLCIEAKCDYIDPLVRTEELFQQLKMHKTQMRNAVIIYIAYQHKEFGLYGDEGFNELIEHSYWESQRDLLKKNFQKKKYEKGILEVIDNLGTELSKHFPYDGSNKNELPDKIVFA